MALCINEETMNAYFDGELGREARAGFMEHLALCEACARKAQSMEQAIFLMDGVFDEELPDCVPTESLRVRLDTALSGNSSLAYPVSSATLTAWRAFFSRLVAGLGMTELAPRHFAAAILSGLAVVALFLWLNAKSEQTVLQNPDLDKEIVQQKEPQPPVPSDSEDDPQPDKTETHRQQTAANGRNRSGAGRHRGKPRRASDISDPDPFKVSEDTFDLTEPPMVSTVIIEPGERVTFFDSETTRHLEQAQVLLRSFKNASFSRAEAISDLAYEREKSRELLYRNIMYRRDAEADGNAPVTALLSELEPFLLDIANLPERPSSSDLKFIKERLQRNEIVIALQVYSSRIAPVASLQ